MATDQVRIDLGDTGQICLSWGALPADLDLHLKIDAAATSHEVHYSQKGSVVEEPWAQLDTDIQSGSGTETIAVTRWIDGKYHCAVHNYSGNPALAGCGARVTFTCGQEQRQFQCPIEGTGDWWSVFALDAKTGKIDVINEIGHRPW
jgi:uncharacterized protein YfaP (DUF2135 family)